MRQPFLISLVVLLVSAFPVLAQERSHVVLISIDGMRGDYLWDDARYHLKIPILKALAAAGSFAEAAESVTPTLTYPAHATLVTGVYPGRHGILAFRSSDFPGQATSPRPAGRRRPHGGPASGLFPRSHRRPRADGDLGRAG